MENKWKLLLSHHETAFTADITTVMWCIFE